MMNKTFYVLSLLLLSILYNSYSQHSMQTSQKLKSEIKDLFNATNGDFALVFIDLAQAKDPIFINEKESFHAASTMKTPVMIEVFKQSSEGKFSLDDSLIVKNEFKSIVDGSFFSLDIGRDDGEHIYEQIGQPRSIRDLVVDMIIYSSNLATNIIMELVGAENVNRTMRELGANDIQVLRGVEDMKAYEAGKNNSITAYDLMLIFEKLAKEEVVNTEASKEMIDILLAQTHTSIIPAKLPKDVKVANKTGFITGIHHDSGIVYLPDGRKYVLVLTSKNMDDFKAGTNMLAEVSAIIHEYFVGK
jgi:beta-lactamase class A